jgi:hypothetical protein
VSRLISTLIASFVGLMILAASPTLAGDRPGGGGGHHGGGHGGGGHPGGGCRGGCGGGGHYGGNINVNVNANANANAYASAGAGSFINARAYDMGQVTGGYGGHGGMVAVGSGGIDLGGYGYGGGYGYVYVSGPGYGPSRPFGYTVHGFGRRYVTTDRCGGCRPPRPRPCDGPCSGGYHHGGGHGHVQGYSTSYGHGYAGGYIPGPLIQRPPQIIQESPQVHFLGCEQGVCEPIQAPVPQGYAHHDGGSASGSSYSAYESYSERSSYGGGYAYGGGQTHGQGGVTGGPQYAPAPPTYQPAPIYVTPPAGYYGDLPPGDTGEGRPYRQEMPYRQEPGERG